MNKSIVEIQGFKKLNSKINQLSDKIKKREMLKILRIASKPTIQAARAAAPVSEKIHKRYGKKGQSQVLAIYSPGNLKKSIGNILGKKGFGKNNAVIYVGPRSKGKKYDGYYGAFLEYGTVNMKPQPFMGPAYNKTKGQVTADAENKTIKLIQKKINQLSN